MNLEYVLSGITFFRIGTKRITEDEELVQHIKNIFTKFNEYFKENQCSLLFNAFTEKDLSEFVPSYGTKTYVDSGGLQIITVKKQELTEEMKTEIYQTQSLGNYAMCFDEIPLYIDEDKKGATARTDMSGKFVVGEQVYDKGVATGKNIRKQIDHFKLIDANTKVFIILQGNSPDDWMNFSNGIFSQLDWNTDKEYIEGLAIADTCIGNGVLEALDMFSIIPQLNCPESIKKRIHLLGVGGVSRLIPIISLIKSGYLSEDTYISYDSTSLSNSIIFGRYFLNGKIYNFPRVKEGTSNKTVDLIVDDIQKNIKKMGWTEFARLSHDEFKDYFIKSTLSTSKSIYEHECPITEKKMFGDVTIMFMLIVMSQLVNFTEYLSDIVNDEKKYKKYINSQNKTKILSTLKGIKSYNDYQEWRKFAINNKIHSNRISRVDTYEEFLKKTINKNSLENWF